jgi:hypothetical protein
MKNLKSHLPTNSQSRKHLSPKSLSNDALLRTTQALVIEERKLTTEILWHLNEIQIRRLYSEKGYASLFEYAVRALGYSHAAAGRRIAAMRLLADVPEVESALQKGSVNLSTLSTIQTFVQKKWQSKKESVSKAEKKELVLALQGKSRRECEKHLIALDPIAATPQERERMVSPTQTEIRFVADDELMQKLQKIRELDGHVQSNASYLELFHRMADLALRKLDPTAKKEKPVSANNSPAPLQSATVTVMNCTQPEPVPNSTPPAESKPQGATSESCQSGVPSFMKKSNPRYIPAALKREIWRRDQGQCTFQSAGGKRCLSRFALEIDHIEPLALGGQTKASSLRLLCRAHNQHQAWINLGPQKMSAFLRRSSSS